MYDLTLGTPVFGIDKPIGRLTGVVCDPRSNEIVDLVVNADDVPGGERLVPIDWLAASHDDRLELAMSRRRFFHLKTLETERQLPGHAADEADVFPRSG
jgi:hypothetical protein